MKAINSSRAPSLARNFGIIAHIDAGKTTLSERILVATGALRRAGEVHDGAAAMDHMDLEKERGISIGAAATQTDWKEHRFTLIDTPGHIDFAIEVERSLRVLDGAVTVLCGVAGIQPQTETVWRQAQKHQVPMLIFVNKMDRVGADFERVLAQIKTRLEVTPVALQIPIGAGDAFAGTIDVLAQRYLTWDAQGKMQIADLPAELLPIAKQAYAQASALAAEASEELTDAYLTQDGLDEAQIWRGLRTLSLARKAVMVLAGSAYKNAGIDPLLDAVIDWLPAPQDRPAPVAKLDDVEVLIGTAQNDPLAALVFKVVHDDHGSLAFVRVYGGTLREGDMLWNANLNCHVRVGRMYIVHAQHRHSIRQASAGEIVAIAGLKDVLTGHTLASKEHAYCLEAIAAAEPVVALAVEPGAGTDRAKMLVALERMRREDPSLRLESNLETGETILWGMGELHLDVVLERVRREAGVAVHAGAPQVAYKETIKGPMLEVEGKVSKQNGGKGQYARVVLRVEPCKSAFEFEIAVKGGAVPAVYFAAIEKGVRQALLQGPLGQPVTGVKVSLLDGDFHAVDSSDMAFTVAAKEGVLAGLLGAHPQLLEPVMLVTVDAPAANAGDVIGDLQRRNGRVHSIQEQAGRVEVIANVPLVKLFGHTTDLRSLTQGRAFASMAYAGHVAQQAA